MAYQKLQGIRAINVYPQDGVPVPNPASKVTNGGNTSVSALQLVDTSNTFVSLGIKAGDVVYNTTTKKSATVSKVVSQTTLDISNDIFLATPENYVIYSVTESDGPVLYIGVGGDVGVVTAGGDSVVFAGVNGGSFFPVMVKEVLSSGTTATDIIALF